MLAQFDDIDLVKMSFLCSVYLYKDSSTEGAVYVRFRKFSLKKTNYNIEKVKFMINIDIVFLLILNRLI
jgi:hypothetical protein